MHEAINQLKIELRIQLPNAYEQFLLSGTKGARDDGLLLYSTTEILERNNVFEVQRYTPELLAVGDDSGGRLIVIHHADILATPFIVDAGALIPNTAPRFLRELAPTWSYWADHAFLLPRQ